MARYDHLPLFKATYNLCLEIYKVTANYSREYKFTLGETMKELSHDIVDTVIETNSLENKNKTGNLYRLLIKIEKLRIYLRISCDLKILSPQSLGKSAEMIEDIRKQTGGWINYVSCSAR